MMKDYNVIVHCESDFEITIQADDEATALRLAEEDVANRYIVYGRDEDEYYPFDDLIAYTPKENS
jgi:hypothetical protein